MVVFGTKPIASKRFPQIRSWVSWFSRFPQIKLWVSWFFADLGQRWMKGVSGEFALKKLREQPIPW